LFLLVRFSSTNCFFPFWLNRKDANYISSVGILIYLGAVLQVQVIFLEQGVIKVNGSLAIMNNALIPVIVNLVIWNKEADIKKILIGGSLILSLNECT
jgi:hypothetical protein